MCRHTISFQLETEEENVFRILQCDKKEEEEKENKKKYHTRVYRIVCKALM